MSELNRILFLPSNDYFLYDKHNKWVRERLSSSIYASFYPFPSSSDFRSSSYFSPKSPLFPRLRLKLHHYLCHIIFPYFYSLPLPILNLQYFPISPFSIHSLPICLPPTRVLCPSIYLHIRIHTLHIPLPHSLNLCFPLSRDLYPPLHLHLHLRLPPLPIPLFYLFLFHSFHDPILPTYIFLTITFIQTTGAK